MQSLPDSSGDFPGWAANGTKEIVDGLTQRRDKPLPGMAWSSEFGLAASPARNDPGPSFDRSRLEDNPLQYTLNFTAQGSIIDTIPNALTSCGP